MLDPSHHSGQVVTTTQPCESLSSCSASVKRQMVDSTPYIPTEADVVVVRAGLAGLNASSNPEQGWARAYHPGGKRWGRRVDVRTDKVDGFLLDRGFQIFLTGYPEAKATLDLEALQLQPFYAGAKVWFGGSFHTVADPLRHFVDGVLSLGNPIGSVADKINVGVFRLKSLLGPLDAIFEQPETSTLERLKVCDTLWVWPHL